MGRNNWKSNLRWCWKNLPLPAKFVFGGIFAIGIMVCTARIASHLKGEITIEVADRRYAAGDNVTGTMTIVAKQPMKRATVYAYLQAKEGRNSGGRRSKRQRLDSWSEKIQISGPINLAVGQRQTFNFSFGVPRREELIDSDVTPRTTESSGMFTKTYGRPIRWSIVG